MARTSQQITEQEIQAYTRFCDRHGIVNDDGGSPDAVQNAEIVANYFVNVWKEEMTDQNFDLAFPQLQASLKFYVPNQKEYDGLFTSLSLEEQSAWKAWKGTRGLKNTFHNGVALLTWIKSHGFKVTEANLMLAVQQRNVSPLLEWDPYQSQPLKGRVVHEDDGTPTAFKERGGDLRKQSDGTYGKSRADYAREAAAVHAKNNPTAPDSVKLLEAQARQDAENIRGNSRYQDSLLSKTFVTNPGTSDINWTETAAARRALLRTMVQEAIVEARKVRQ